MAAPLLPVDDVQAYVAGDRRRAAAAGRSLPEDVRGAGLFADISGFTSLAEALADELGPARGAEELTAALDAVFAALLGTLERHGGEAIYFSGDAVTCWLDNDDGLLAAACALAMQDDMARVGTCCTPGGRTVTLRLKVAVAVGAAHRFVVGDPEVQLIDVLAGHLIDALAETEHRAAPGQVVLHGSAAAALAGRVEAPNAVLERLLVPAPLPPPRGPLPDLPPAEAGRWVLPAVYERLASGRGEFLADLRPAVPLFLRFGGLDFDADPGARDELDALVRGAQRVVHAAGGDVLQLTIGDKGAYLYAVFGAPAAHEDDAVRACHAALRLLALDGTTRATGFSVGVSTGRVRSGTYGSRSRRTYCCLGDPVNLAARLMAAAPTGSAWATDAVRRLTGDAFRWDELPLLPVKGKTLPAAVAALRGARRTPRAGLRQHTGPILGRDDELRELLDAYAQARQGRGQVVRITAEAGLGKSRLLTALGAALAEQGTVLHVGAAPAFGGQGGYEVWRGALRSALLLGDDDPPAAVAARVDELVEAADPRLLPRAPLLGAVLGADLPDTAITASFDAALRKASLETLVVQVLDARETEVLAVGLEDVHWADALSLELLDAVARAAPRLPLLLVLTRRPPDPTAAPVAEGPTTSDLELPELDDAAARALLTRRVQERASGGAREVDPRILDRLVERGHGNPFHLEELLGHLLDRGVDLRSARADDLDLPETLQRLVLTRVDDLPEDPRRALKVASVVGRAFTSRAVAGAYPELGDVTDVEGHVVPLVRGSLVLPEGAPGAYAFRHALTEEVAYDSLPFATRRVLHDRVGTWLEANAPGGPDTVLDLLAHHADRGNDLQRKRNYLLRAGVAAQERYANEAAADWFRRALPVVEDGQRPGLLERLGTVLERRGAWDAAEQAYADALAAHEHERDALGTGRALTELAEIARKQGRFDEASDRLVRAVAATDDAAVLGRVLHLQGTIASQQGRFEEARAAYQRSLAVRERLGDRASVGALLSNLAVVAEQEGDLEQAQALGEQALAVREKVGDPWAICVSRNNLGMVALLRGDPALARDHLRESLLLAELVGDLWMVAVGNHTLGNALLELGDVSGAATRFAEAVGTYAERDDAWSLALLAEDVLRLAVRTGRSVDALRLRGAADALRATLTAPRGPAVADALERDLATARDEVPDADVELQAGGALSRSELLALLRNLCHVRVGAS